MSSPKSRDELKEELLGASRRLGAQATLWSQAVAERLGLAATDVECLDVLLREGPSTVGRLAELTGLTTGSATRMVDRLEQAGFVRRVPDPGDRRRVLVGPVPGVDAKLSALHRSFYRAQLDLVDRYDDATLRLLADFVIAEDEIIKAETARMRGPSEGDDAGGSYAARVGGATSGRLIFVSGAPRISLRGDATLTDLYRASFQGPVPRVRVRDGAVTIAYPRFAWFDWRAQVAGQTMDVSAHWGKDRGEILLNAGMAWAVEMRGGVSRLNGDLRQIHLRSFEVRGGASHLELKLAEPTGIVPIRLAGGANRLEIARPAGTAVGLEVRGGVHDVTVDGEIHKSGGSLSIQTPGADTRPDRYEIEVGGGVNKLSISTF